MPKVKICLPASVMILKGSLVSSSVHQLSLKYRVIKLHMRAIMLEYAESVISGKMSFLHLLVKYKLHQLGLILFSCLFLLHTQMFGIEILSCLFSILDLNT